MVAVHVPASLEVSSIGGRLEGSPWAARNHYLRSARLIAEIGALDSTQIGLHPKGMRTARPSPGTSRPRAGPRYFTPNQIRECNIGITS
jgi:hypothetical protein